MSDPAREVREIQELLTDTARRIGRLFEQGDVEAGVSLSCDTTIPAGRRFALARNRAGLSQVELAQMSGISANTIINFENNRSHPRPKTLMRLAEHVGEPWDAFLELEGRDGQV